MEDTDEDVFPLSLYDSSLDVSTTNEAILSRECVA